VNTNLTQPATRRGEFLNGMRDTVPLIAGAIPFGIIFGAVAVTSGLTPAGALEMSAFVFAGSAQFIGVGLVAQGISTALIVITTFIVNLRHALYAASLAPYMKYLPQKWLLPLGFWLTDETFAVVITRYRTEDESRYKHWYHLGSAVLMYSNWQLCTGIGIIAGGQIKDPASWGLDFAMVVTFIGIVVPLISGRPELISVLAAGAVAVAANGLPNRLGLMVAALAGIAAGVIAETMQKPPVGNPEVVGEVRA